MKQLLNILLMIFTLMAICLPAESVFAQDYRLGPGDVLNISVWGHEELQVEELSVRPDGKIAFPLVGEVMASGKSVAELSHELTNSLAIYVKDPKVTVNVFKFRTTRVYVLGQVTKPGLYEIEKQHNLLDAIGLAGGYTKDAAKKKVHIIRKDNTGTPIKANLVNLLSKGDMTQNYTLNDGDVVFLSDNNRLDFAKDILPWISAAYQVSEMQEN